MPQRILPQREWRPDIVAPQLPRRWRKLHHAQKGVTQRLVRVLGRPAAYLWLPDVRIACQTRSGVAGMSMWRMPNSESASTSEFIIEGRAPAQPASPQPFAP